MEIGVIFLTLLTISANTIQTALDALYVNWQQAPPHPPAVVSCLSTFVFLRVPSFIPVPYCFVAAMLNFSCHIICAFA